jgi:hypothetical protein
MVMGSIGETINITSFWSLKLIKIYLYMCVCVCVWIPPFFQKHSSFQELFLGEGWHIYVY